MVKSAVAVPKGWAKAPGIQNKEGKTPPGQFKKQTPAASTGGYIDNTMGSPTFGKRVGTSTLPTAKIPKKALRAPITLRTRSK